MTFFPAGSDSSSQIIEGAIVFLIELFRDCSLIGSKEISELRRMFGLYPKDSVSKAFDLIKKCIEDLNDDVKDNFIRNGFPKIDEGLLVEEFGSKIKVIGQTPLDDSFFLIPFKEDDEPEDAFEKLSFKFKEPAKEKPAETVVKKPSPPQPRKCDKDWLQNALQDSMQHGSSNISPAELCVTVCQLLKTAKNNEEIQNEVSLTFHCINTWKYLKYFLFIL